MSDFLDNLQRAFRDPNEPSINEDRLFQMTGINQFTVMFKRCNHFLNVPWRVIDGMLSSHEVIKYVNELPCKMCEEQFTEMERKLNAEYHLFVKYGGKL